MKNCFWRAVILGVFLLSLPFFVYAELPAIIMVRDNMTWTVDVEAGTDGTVREIWKYSVTEGVPVGETEDITYDLFRDDPNETRGTIHGFTCQSLDNLYTRFTLEFTVPEGLVISVFDPPDGDTFMYFTDAIHTSAVRTTLIFDISDSNLRAVDSVTIGFIDQQNNYNWVLGLNFNPRQRINYYMNLTDGVPVGDPETLEVDVYEETHGTIHSLICQPLDNDYSRFILEYTVPERLAINIFDPPDGDHFSCAGEATSDKRSTLRFDISNAALESIPSITLVFRDHLRIYGETSFYFIVSFNPPQRRTSDFSCNLTDGSPSESPRRIPYSVYHEQPPLDTGSFPGFTAQSLNNGYTRFTLQFSLSEGLGVQLGVYQGANILLWYESITDNQVTANGPCSLQFDVRNTDLDTVTLMAVNFPGCSAQMRAECNDDFLERMATVAYLPEDLQRIEDEAFENMMCSAVIVPNSCTYIGHHAFRNCRSLRYIRIPGDAVIEQDAFDGCSEFYVNIVP